MPWIKIFISHSTKTEQAEAFLDAVTKALEADFDVRLDKTGLQGGDDWRAKLYQWMDEAHGAVLLLTPEAVTSKFVQLEASVLSWRRFRQPKFVLLPVLAGAGVCDLSKGLFGEMELSRIQALNLDDPAALAQEVAKNLLTRAEIFAMESTAFSHGVTPSAPHHSSANDPGNDSKNSSST